MEALLIGFSKWLAATSLSHTIQTVTWIIPTLQTIHILCVAIAFSSAVLVDLRIFRLFDRDEPLREVTRRFLPPIWPVLVILLTATLQRTVLAQPGFFEERSRRLIGQALATLSVLVWCGILFAGRWIAYTQAG